MTKNKQSDCAISAQITTLTLNPAIDITIGLEKLVIGEVNRAKTYRADIGGKGINVAATLAAGGFKTAVTGILGNKNADIFQKFFTDHDMENYFLYAQGATRSNIKLVSDTKTTDINLPGLPATPEILDHLYHLLAKSKSRFLILSGSLPPQCPDSFYADFLKFYAKQTKNKMNIPAAKCIVDCSGKPLKALLNGKIKPFCIKPNEDELAEWAGKTLKSQKEILEKARALQKTGINLVVISMGSKGALFVTSDDVFHAKITLDKIESTVGAGDAMVAGISAALLRHNADYKTIDTVMLKDIAITATLWAAGKLQCHGPSLPAPEQMQMLAKKICCEKLS